MNLDGLEIRITSTYGNANPEKTYVTCELLRDMDGVTSVEGTYRMSFDALHSGPDDAELQEKVRAKLEAI